MTRLSGESGPDSSDCLLVSQGDMGRQGRGKGTSLSSVWRGQVKVTRFFLSEVFRLPEFLMPGERQNKSLGRIRTKSEARMEGKQKANLKENGRTWENWYHDALVSVFVSETAAGCKLLKTNRTIEKSGHCGTKGICISCLERQQRVLETRRGRRGKGGKGKACVCVYVGGMDEDGAIRRSSQSAADAGMSKRGERRVCERVCVCVWVCLSSRRSDRNGPPVCLAANESG